MAKQRGTGWRPWGDHPLVVLIVTVAALISIIVFIIGKPNLLDLWRGSPPVPPLSPPVAAKKVLLEDSIDLHSGESYRFPFKVNATLTVKNFHKLDELNMSEITVEFNIEGIMERQNLKVNQSRSFSIDDKEYSFLVTKIYYISTEPFARFSLIVKGRKSL